jgi:hypothetical protein
MANTFKPVRSTPALRNGANGARGTWLIAPDTEAVGMGGYGAALPPLGDSGASARWAELAEAIIK